MPNLTRPEWGLPLLNSVIASFAHRVPATKLDIWVVKRKLTRNESRTVAWQSF